METWFYKKKNRTFCGELSFEIMGTSMSTSFQTENGIEFVARIVTIDLLIYLFIYFKLISAHLEAWPRSLWSIGPCPPSKTRGEQSQPWKSVKITSRGEVGGVLASTSFTHSLLRDHQTLILSLRSLFRSLSPLFCLPALLQSHLCARSGGHLDLC
jgi:hypothetical protein